MDMIEKVARAIDPMAWAVPWEDYPAERARREARQAGSLMTARRAIEAMREPTGDMLEAFIQTAASQGVAFEEDSPAQYPAPIYMAMIDAALK